MQRSVRKSTLQTLVEEKTLSVEGKNWLTQATDPFHDSSIELAGLPDLNIASSVMQCVKQTFTIKADTTKVGTGNWDCNFVLWPNPTLDLNTQLFRTVFGTDQILTQTFTTGIHPYPMGGLTAFAVPTGDATYGTENLEVQFEQIGPTAFVDGCYRVVAQGFEVVNSTAVLSKQGDVVVYRQPMPDCRSTLCTCFTSASDLRKDSCCPSCEKDRSGVQEPAGKPALLPTSAGWMSTYHFDQPPGSVGDAMLLEGSKRWEAENGVYCISTMNCLDNPPMFNRPIMLASWEAGPGDSGDGQAICSTLFGTPTSTIFYPAGNHNVQPWNLAGAYFTGLSPTTTLTATAVWYIETFPNPITDRRLVTMASPSPAFDPAALEIYGRAMKYLPVGVMQGENPLGEWFTNVLDAVRDYAVPIAKGVGMVVPGVGAVANGVENVIGAIRPIAKQVRKKERQKAAKMISKRAQSADRRAGPGS